MDILLCFVLQNYSSVVSHRLQPDENIVTLHYCHWFVINLKQLYVYFAPEFNDNYFSVMDNEHANRIRLYFDIFRGVMYVMLLVGAYVLLN